MRLAAATTLFALLCALGAAAPARAATDDATETNPPPQSRSGHECERRRETPTS